MTTEFAVAVVVKVTLALSMALAATWTLRRRAAALRHLILTATFAAIAVLPFAAAWPPTVAIHAPVAIAPAEGAWFDDADVFPRGPGDGSRVLASAKGDDPPTAARWYRRPGLSRLLAAVWLLGAGVSMLPVAVGAWHRADVKRAVIHELEHIRRHDCLIRLAARMVSAMYWYHPLVWVAWRQLELEAERACDGTVGRVSEPTGYADQLIALAERVVAAGRRPLLTMASRNDLARRIASVLADNRPRGRTRLRSVGAVGACAALLVTAVAPLRAINAVIPAVVEQATSHELPLLPPPTLARQLPSQVPSMSSRADALPRVPAVAESHTSPDATAIPGTIGPAADRAARSPQINAGVAAAQSKPDEAPPRFEVATLKVNRAGGRPVPPRVLPASGQVTIANATVASVIQDAYGVQLPSQIINLPDWARSLRVDIVAKAASPAPVAVLQRMLQPLLTEYFKFAAHTEMREMDAFALVLTNPGRPGPKLQRVDDACGSVVGTTIGFARPSDGPDQRQVCGVLPSATAGQIIAHGITLTSLATELAPSQRRPVLDRTGLSGRFDVELTWTPEAFSAASLAQRPGSTPPPGVDPAGPPLPTALQDQLGLKFESRREAVEVLVIDRAEPLTATD